MTNVNIPSALSDDEAEVIRNLEAAFSVDGVMPCKEIQIGSYLFLQTEDCAITIENYPTCHIRGPYVVKIEADGATEFGRNFNESNSDNRTWPRWYFDLTRTKLEVKAWLKVTGQYVESAYWEVRRA